jgi:hypothetical protein
MARDYSKIAPQFWIGTTGRLIRELGRDAQLAALYLVTSPHANMLGLYYLPLPYLSHETGIPLEGALKALRSLEDVGFAFYDESEEVVWVPQMARYQVAETLKPTDKRVQGIVNELARYRKSRFHELFLNRYAAAFNLPVMAPAAANAAAFEAPANPLRSQEQEQEQEEEQEQEQEKLARSRARGRERPAPERSEANGADDAPPPRPMLLVDDTELAPEAAEVRGRVEAELGRRLLVATPGRETETRARFEAQVELLGPDLVVAICVDAAKRLWDTKHEQVASLAYFVPALEDAKPTAGEKAPEPPALADFAPGARWDALISAMTPAQVAEFEAEKQRIYDEVVGKNLWTSKESALLLEAEGFLFTKWSRRVAGQPRTAGGTA